LGERQSSHLILPKRPRIQRVISERLLTSFMDGKKVNMVCFL
jgi:hypothetical protein